MPNLSRKDMPQVKTQDLGKALSMVSDKVKVTKETIPASKLKKSQKELYKDKVKGIANRFNSPKAMKPLIISKDNHIVDGHHRWGAAIYKWGEDVKIPVYRINLSVNNAIKLYKHIADVIDEVIKEAITIPIEIGDTVLGGKFKNKPIVVKSIDKNEKGDITINGKPLLKFRLKEGVWSSSAISAMNRKSMDAKYFLTDENGDILTSPYKLKTMSSVHKTFKIAKIWGGFSSNEVPKIVNVHDLKKDGKVVEQYNWTETGAYSKNIESKYIKYKNIEKQLNSESVNEANAVSGGKVHKFITGKNLTFKGKKYPNLYFEVLRIDNNSKMVTLKILSPKQLFGKELDVPFKTIRRGPFLKTDTSGLGENVAPNHNGKSAPYGSGYSQLDEIPMGDLQKIDQFADKKLNPIDIVITDKHFFDQINNPRNGKEISNAELIGFFKRLSKKKKEFVEFLNKYNSLVATDDRTNINIPFMKQANKAIAKTIMRKKDFKTPDKKLDI